MTPHINFVLTIADFYRILLVKFGDDGIFFVNLQPRLMRTGAH